MAIVKFFLLSEGQRTGSEEEAWWRKGGKGKYIHTLCRGMGVGVGAQSLNSNGPAVCAGACLHRHQTASLWEGRDIFLLAGSDPVGFCDAIGLILMQHKVKSCAVTVWKYCEDDVCGDNHVPLKLPPIEHKSYTQTQTYIYVWILNRCLKSLCTMFFLGRGDGSCPFLFLAVSVLLYVTAW